MSKVQSQTEKKIDPRWDGEFVVDSKGNRRIVNSHITGTCNRTVYGGPHPRRFCNNPCYKGGRCKLHHNKFRWANTII